MASGILILLVLFFPLGLSLLGFVLPPPRNKPVGVLYWVALGWILLFLGLVEVGAWLTVVAHQAYGNHMAWWQVAALFPIPVGILLLLANTLWGLGQAKRILEGWEEEAQWENLRRLSRRMWLPLLAIPVLILVLGVGVGLLAPVSVRAPRSRPLPPTTPPKTSSPPVSPAP